MTCTVEGFRVWGIGLIQRFQACTPGLPLGFGILLRALGHYMVSYKGNIKVKVVLGTPFRGTTSGVQPRNH